jgi:hypothetical protein
MYVLDLPSRFDRKYLLLWGKSRRLDCSRTWSTYCIRTGGEDCFAEESENENRNWYDTSWQLFFNIVNSGSQIVLKAP